MKLSLTDVSSQQHRKQGFLTSSVVINKDMILIHKVDKGVVLDNHNHPHVQLGYCFCGSFDFEVEGNHFDATPGYSFLLKGMVYHSAVATTDFYSMDIKVMVNNDNLPRRISSDVFECVEDTERYALKTAKVGNCHVQKISYIKSTSVDVDLDLARDHFVIVSEPCTLRFGILLTSLNLEPMKIYRLEVDTPKFCIETETSNVEVLIVTY